MVEVVKRGNRQLREAGQAFTDRLNKQASGEKEPGSQMDTNLPNFRRTTAARTVTAKSSVQQAMSSAFLAVDQKVKSAG